MDANPHQLCARWGPNCSVRQVVSGNASNSYALFADFSHDSSNLLVCFVVDPEKQV
jgi:hypothetical protein